MGKSAALAAALAVAVLSASAPAQAAGCWGPSAINAAKLRNLDIMLMVTGLRCRTGPDNFQPAYYDFAAAHQAELNAADTVLRAELASEAGPDGARRALDEMSTSIANSYGVGHPALGCRELKLLTSDLAATRVPGALLNAAEALVVIPELAARKCAVRVATTRR